MRLRLGRRFWRGDGCAPGDCGRIDPHGTTFFLGRIKDMLKVGGENVAAAEIEAFMGRHPAVKLTQVVGKADERLRRGRGRVC